MTMKEYQYLIQPNIAQIRSNKRYIHYFSFGDHLIEEHSSSSSSSNLFSIKIAINVVKDIIRPSGLGQRFQTCYGSDRKDEIYFERHLGLGIKAKLHIKNLLNMSEFTVNKNYHRFVKFKADNVYPPGIHLADILSVNLLERKYVPIHCAAISNGNGGILLVAPSNTGKTLTTMLALNCGFHYVSEDIAIVDEEYVYANPYTSTFNHYEDEESKANNANNGRPMRAFISKIPLLNYYVQLSKTSMTAMDLIKNSKIDQKVKIQAICILSRGKESGTEKIDPEEALRRVLIINRNEFSYYKNPLLFAYSYFNPTFSINHLGNIEEKILHTIINKADCFLLRSNDPSEYIKLVKNSFS
jgi:hypothetical protein